MKLSRAQRWKLHKVNQSRLMRGLKAISAEVFFNVMTLGENEQNLMQDRNSEYPYDLLNPNFKNNGNIANLQNPSFEQIERGNYDKGQHLLPDRVEVKMRPFTLNAGDIVNIMPRNLKRNFIEIQSDVSNTVPLYVLFYARDDTLITTIINDAYSIPIGGKKLFENRIPINSVSFHNASAVAVVTGTIFWG